MFNDLSFVQLPTTAMDGAKMLLLLNAEPNCNNHNTFAVFNSAASSQPLLLSESIIQKREEIIESVYEFARKYQHQFHVADEECIRFRSQAFKRYRNAKLSNYEMRKGQIQNT